jgi:membrane protein implicated in regulation of membrane protease activity
VGKRIAVGTVVWVGVSALAFLLLYWVLALFVAIVVAAAVLVVIAASDWDQHSTFEERELARSRKRAAKRERTKGARTRDRERWAAHQAKKAAREQG